MQRQTLLYSNNMQNNWTTCIIISKKKLTVDLYHSMKLTRESMHVQMYIHVYSRREDEQMI